jgi:hypothetical protein
MKSRRAWARASRASAAFPVPLVPRGSLIAHGCRRPQR